MMKTTTLACVSVLALALTPALAAPAHAGGCPPVQRYIVGGAGDPGSTGVPHVPAGYRVHITYPADVLRGDYSRSVASSKLDRTARAYRTFCPNGRIEVYGHSLGSSAASLTIDRWQTQPRMAHNTSAVLYGNPRTRVAHGFGGIETVGLPHVPGVYTWRGQYRSGPIPIRNVCHRNDLICHAPRPLHRDLAAAWTGLQGYLGTAHQY